jgi:hypothetical protein
MEEFSKEKKNERMNKNSSEINKNFENSEEKVLKEISLLRQVLNKINIIEKNKLDLDEKKEIENDRNIQ